MKLLIAADRSRFFYLEQFANSLIKKNIDCELVYDLDIYGNSFLEKKYLRWFSKPQKFNNLILKHKPDLVFTERENHFSILTSEMQIPLIRYLRGDYWAELRWAKQTTKAPQKYLELLMKERIAKKCFKNAALILPICNYLRDIAKDHYKEKTIRTMYQGIDPNDWYFENKISLKHPCVGLLQNAIIWGKTKEMLILENVIKKMPDVTFYWAGDGPHKNSILSILGKYDNFKWLGSLQYPDKVREFLSEIDVYALISGQDMSPHTMLEAALMEKPIIATNVGGIKENMKNNETGFLVEEGDYEDIIRKISILINDTQKSKQMGKAGQNFIKENFTWDKIASDFVAILKSDLNLS